jgi:fructose-1,6-bisphosphatase/sedoheptulose 1,7-bisphosphatase-like protein
VRLFAGGATTNSLAMRSRSGTIRWIESCHNFSRLDKLSFFDLH